LPQSPSPPNRAHRITESRQERLVRWRCDIMIAATALVAGMPLVHHNPRDFETIRMAIETSPQRSPARPLESHQRPPPSPLLTELRTAV